MIRSVNLLAARIGLLTGMLGAALLLALPAAAAVTTMAPSPVSGADWTFNATPAAYSLTHIGPRPTHNLRRVPPPPRRIRLFGYPSANADELPAPPAASVAPALLFTHAALGVAMLDAPAASTGSDAVATADSGRLNAAELDLTMPATPRPVLPSPLPITLIVALVLLPAGLVLGQALRGPSGRPRPAMRRQSAPRRRIKD